jgi:hypothetical protein
VQFLSCELLRTRARRRSEKTNLPNGKTHKGLTKMCNSRPPEPFLAPDIDYTIFANGHAARARNSYSLSGSRAVSRSESTGSFAWRFGWRRLRGCDDRRRFAWPSLPLRCDRRCWDWSLGWFRRHRWRRGFCCLGIQGDLDHLGTAACPDLLNEAQEVPISQVVEVQCPASC